MGIEMDIFYFILLFLILSKKISLAERHNLELEKYLDNLSDGLQYQNIKYPKIRQAGSVLEESSILQYYRRSDETSDPEVNIFTFFKKTLFAIDDEIFLGTLNQSLSMDSYGIFQHERSIVHRAIEYQQTGFLALGSKNLFSFYTLTENQTSPELIQTVANQYSSDGIFFINSESLYFVTSSNPGEHLGSITCYKWLGSYFDETETIHVTGVVSLSSFAHSLSEIIIAAQRLPRNQKIQSSVYRFREGKLRKIQQLSTIKPTHMNIFFQNDTPFVLIYEEMQNQNLYKWNGFEMVFVNTFHWEHKVDKSVVVYSNDIPLIVQPQLDKVLVFQPQNEDIQLSRRRDYHLNYSVILDVNKGENENGNITFIVGLDDDDRINIYGMSFKARAEIKRTPEGTLRNCFNDLETKVYDRRKKLNQMSNGSVDVTNLDTDNSNTRKKRASVGEENIREKLDNLKDRLDSIKTHIINRESSLNQVVINQKATIKCNINSKSVKVNKITLNDVNNKAWTPNMWLQNNKEQIINGRVKTNKITTTELIATETFFKNMLRRNGNQNISENFIINNLIATKIFADQINNIKIDDIYKINSLIPVKGIKEFENVIVETANITKINGKETEEMISNLLNNTSKIITQFAPNVKIDNIEVETIDDVHWEQFEDSLFKIGEDNIIEGNLSVSVINVNNLQVKLVNGIHANHLMTKSTDQIINSTVEFNTIKTPNLKCTTVNDADINHAVLTGQNITNIEGHVKIEGINVLKDLELKGNIDQYFFLKGNNRTFGTNKSDLIQRYLGKVVINGSLYVNDFSALQNTTILLRGTEYTIEVLNEYWTKNDNQTIPIHFEAINGISVTHLHTKTLNELAVEIFALNTNNLKIQSPLFFENVTVYGNVTINDNTSNIFGLKKLADVGVKNDGASYKIKGKKIFTKKLHVKDLDVSEKDYNTDLHKARQDSNKTLLIIGNLISKNVHTTTINNNNISNYVDKLVPLGKPQNLTNMEFKDVIVDNLYVSTINGKNVTEYIEKLQNIAKNKRIGILNVSGNVTLHTIKNVKHLNGHEISELFKEHDSPTNTKDNLRREVKFYGIVKIGNLRARSINNITFPDLTRRLLHKKSNQTVTGIYKFTDLKAEHLHTKNINDKNLESLIDISSNIPQQILAPNNGISFKNILLEKSVLADQMVPCDIYNAIKKIRYPGNKEWLEVEITGNVTMLDQDSDLIYIMKKSVKLDQENIIEAPVTINWHVSADQVHAKENVNKVNLTELIQDAVLNDLDKEQVINGHKIFSNILEAEHAIIMENADIPLVNNIVISKLYNKIIRKDQVNNMTIMGKKTFYRGLQANKFLTNEVAGIKPENIVSLANLKQIPQVLFDTIEVIKNFNVKYVNNYNFNYVLNNRVLTNTSEKQITNAVYYFNHLEIRDNIATPSINNVEIKDVVFDIKEQKIIAPKRFFQNLAVFGNVTIGSLNGINITEEYNNAILHGKDEIINGSMSILKPVNIKGNLTVQRIKGYPIAKIKQTMNQTVNKAEEETIFAIQDKLKNIVENNLPIVNHMPSEFMYIEKSSNLQVRIEDVDASATSVKDYILINILGEESHEKCGLPEGCKCPVQHTVEITSRMSVSYWLNKQQLRIYKYNDNDLMIHLSTNSTSTDRKCRTNQTEENKEISILVWNTSSTYNTSGSLITQPSFFTGYISGVEFFTVNEITYAVIARYYDPVKDTHDLDCIVLRFSENKTTVIEIQKIPTRGAWIMHLLHTAQGITLVVGNLAKEPHTDIHRFDLKTEQFYFLRTVSYGCTQIAGVVLGSDSLIILANKETPLQVLKYNQVYNNYYFYQMFALGEPVLRMSVFYIGDFGISEAYLCIVTEDNYRVYSFQYFDGWKLESRGVMRDLRNLEPFEMGNQLYLFASSDSNLGSTLLSIVKNGKNNY